MDKQEYFRQYTNAENLRSRLVSFVGATIIGSISESDWKQSTSDELMHKYPGLVQRLEAEGHDISTVSQHITEYSAQKNQFHVVAGCYVLQYRANIKLNRSNGQTVVFNFYENEAERIFHGIQGTSFSQRFDLNPPRNSLAQMRADSRILEEMWEYWCR